MRIKSFFVQILEDAMAQARAEFGEDALLLRTRKTPEGYEVVFGSAEKGDCLLCPPSSTTDPATSGLSGQSGLSPFSAPSVNPVSADTATTSPSTNGLSGQSGLSPFSAPSANPASAEKGDCLLCPPSSTTDPATSGLSGQSGLSPFSAPSVNLVSADTATTSPSTNGQSGQSGLSPLSAASAEDDPSINEHPTPLASIRREVEEIRLLLLIPERKRSAAITQILSRLLDAGFDPHLASEIVDAAEASAPAIPIEDRLRIEISRRIAIDPSLGLPTHDGVAVALVGPGGAGKTTTLMKIAAFQSSPERPVRLLTLDHSSLSSRMHLQLFARKTGVNFTPVESPENLPAIVADARGEEIVLIDTPSCPDGEAREKLAITLNACAGIDVHFTAPAYMAGDALRRAIANFRIFRPRKMVITKLDESPRFGGAVSVAARAGLAVSLLTNGTHIPRDLYSASVEDLVLLAAGRRAQAACA